MVRWGTMRSRSFPQSAKENNTVEPKVGDLVNVPYGKQSCQLGYITRIDNNFDGYNYHVFVIGFQSELLFPIDQLEIV